MSVKYTHSTKPMVDEIDVLHVFKRLWCLVIALSIVPPAWSVSSDDCVVLLHGLARTAGSMSRIEKALSQRGALVANISYPSTKQTIEQLAPAAINEGLESCQTAQKSRIHFVTHSMGGILVRYYLKHHELPGLGRVVMIAPPNQGSEVVDNWRKVPGFKLWNGPAGLQLGTGEGSIPNSLGSVDFPLGVIAGNRTVNPILSLSLENPDDGKVSVEKTKVEGMSDFIEVPHTHTFIMRANGVVEQVVYFLENGQFERSDSEDPRQS